MRKWNNFGEDGGSVHCLGNGRLCAYEQGPNVIQVFGPPYSSPSLLRMDVAAACRVESASWREPGGAVWRHRLNFDGAGAAEITDFVAADAPCLVRRLDCETGVTFRLRTPKGVALLPNPSRFTGCGAALLLWAEAGTPIYGAYPTAHRQYMQMLVTGEASCRQTGENEVELAVPPGRCALYCCGGPSYPEAVETAERMLAAGPDALLDGARAMWRTFAGERKDFGSLIPAAFPWKERLLAMIDSVAVLIKAQQGMEGGVLAGYNYHLGYIRDQYGVFRCLLSLGHRGEARSILQFYWDTWTKYGKLNNAQGIGAHAFHVHENDDVEITGYLVIQAFDYLRETGDAAFVAAIAPMLAWAFDAQRRNLAGGMLPFNGDETYIAGGILPRDCIPHGSAEATLQFITGGRLLLDWMEKQGLWSGAELAGNRHAVAEAEALYAANFIDNGRLITNNPARMGMTAPPRFRHGVCQQCSAFGWTEREGGQYLCPQCLQHPSGGGAGEGVHMLKSVSLMPLYIGAGTLPMPLVEGTVRQIASEYLATGRLPSRPDAGSTVGYDYGLLLYNMVKCRLPGAAEVFGGMLSIVDDTDAWVEYYVQGVPHNTRCRPWESGINLHAAIEYALNWNE